MKKDLTETFTIQKLNLSHLDALVALEARIFSLPWSRAAYESELAENPMAHCYGCFKGDQLVAFGGFWQIFDEGHIANVGVHPGLRGRGLGELITRQLIAACTAMNGRAMTLEVRESNEVAHNLYRKLGFYDSGRRPHYYTDNDETAIIMWLEIHKNSRSKYLV